MRRVTRSKASEAAASESAMQTQPPPSGVVVAELGAEALGSRSSAAESAEESEQGRNQPSLCPEEEAVASEDNTIWHHETATIATTAGDQILCPACMRDTGTRLLCLNAKELEKHCKDRHRWLTIV